MDKYVIRELTSEGDIKGYYTMHRECFPTDHDWGLQDISDWIKSQKQSHIFGLFEGEIMIGFRHIWCIKDYNICNVPYAGMKSEYRGKGIYPMFSLETEKIIKDLGFDIITNEVENPNEMKTKESQLLAERRIKMFKNKLGYSIIQNSNDLRYERNSPPIAGDDDMHKSQFEYLLGFKIINPMQKTITFDNNGISKGDYEKLFWSIRYIERGTFDHVELMKLKPISNFISNLCSSEEERFAFY